MRRIISPIFNRHVSLGILYLLDMLHFKLIFRKYWRFSSYKFILESVLVANQSYKATRTVYTQHNLTSKAFQNVYLTMFNLIINFFKTSWPKVCIEISSNNQLIISEKEFKLAVGYFCAAALQAVYLEQRGKLGSCRYLLNKCTIQLYTNYVTYELQTCHVQDLSQL